MAYTKASGKAAQKYQKEKLDDFHVRIRKGKKESWQKAAEDRGMTFTSMLVEAMDDYIARTEKENA